MRVSATGWLYDTLERTREVAKATADVTHNHPDGIKGAESVAAVIFLARTGSSKLLNIDYNWGELEIYSRTQYKLSEECMPYAVASRGIDIEPDDIDVSDAVTFVWELNRKPLFIEISYSAHLYFNWFSSNMNDKQISA